MLNSSNRFAILLAAISLHVFSIAVIAQNKKIDSLLSLLEHSPSDSQKVDLHFRLYSEVESYDVTKANAHLDAAYAIAKEWNSKSHTAYYFLGKGGLFFEMAKYDEALPFFDTAMALYTDVVASKITDTIRYNDYIVGKAECLIGKGLLSAKQYYFQESIQYYLQAIEILQELKGPRRNPKLTNVYGNIASDFYELEQFGHALQYDKKALPYLSKQDIDGYIIGYLFVADDFSGMSEFDSAFTYLEKVRDMVNEVDKPKLNVRFYYILGGIYRKRKEWSSALTNFQKSKEASTAMQDEFQQLSSEEGIAACYLNLGRLSEARTLALQVLDKSGQINVPLGKLQALQLLVAIEEKAGNVNKAFGFQKQLMQVSDSMKKEKVERQMHEVEMKYQNEKREKEILQLQKSNALQSLSLQKQSAFNSFLIGSVAVLLIVGFLGYRNLRHRHQLTQQRDELQQQRIRELEKDKQLVAVDALLKGQEEERSRMAKDLHDGLGGMLSGVKLSLGAMKGNIILSEENTRLFGKVLDQLDHSISEMRRVAHNMMPEALVKLGLQQAIQDYCDGLNESNRLIFKSQFHGLENRLETTTEVVVYRIIQELLNNVVKHAEATTVLVQVMRYENSLNITIEDNGKGFEFGTSKKGSGLNNVRSRVDYLKGQLDIQSAPGKGTSVHIDFAIQP